MNLKEQQYIVTLAALRQHDPGGQKAEHHAARPVLLSGGVGERPGLSPCLSGRERRCGRPIWESSIWRRPGRSWRWGGVPASAGAGPPRLSGPDPGGDPHPPFPHLIPPR